MKVLYTAQNGFDVVFTREREVTGSALALQILLEGKGFICLERLNGINPDTNFGNTKLRCVNYHPHPGSAEAVGHWSRVEDANWKRDMLERRKRDAAQLKPFKRPRPTPNMTKVFY